MNGQLKLSVDQVVVAIRLLDPVEKKKLQKHWPDLFDTSEYVIKQRQASKRLRQSSPQYSFSVARKLLSDVQGNISTQVIEDREDRIWKATYRRSR